MARTRSSRSRRGTMHLRSDDVPNRADAVTGPRPAPRLPLTRLIRNCLKSVSSGAATVWGTILHHSARNDPFANPLASGRHQFWGDEE